SLLAFHPDGPSAAAKGLRSMHAYTDRTRTSSVQLAADLDHARRQGFAVSDEERELGVRGVAVPVFVPGRVVLGAMGVQARTWRRTDGLVGSLAPALRHFAEEIGRRLRDDPLVLA